MLTKEEALESLELIRKLLLADNDRTTDPIGKHYTELTELSYIKEYVENT